MSTELAKTYEPAAVEAEAYRVWTEEKCFHADPTKGGEAYCIVIPPPNVTGALHLGHAINTTLQDILVRNHRMRGFNTLWVPGIDHAGIATQAVVEKQLKEKENKTRHDVGREGLVERIWAWKQQYGDRILQQLKRLGASCDWDRARFTLDDMCAKAVRETFFKLFKDGLIYRGKRLVNWDVHLQTSISDDEIYHETVKTSLWHIRYPIVSEERTEDSGLRTERKGKDGSPISSPSRDTGFQPVRDADGVEEPQSGQIPSTPHGLEARVTGAPAYMIVATTRPETLLGDTAVAVHSEDPRWNWAIGKHVELPLTGRRIPIIADDILVDPKFGTGVVKVTPAHDPNDYAVWQRHQGKADEIALLNILNPDGTINTHGGKYAGMKRDAARKKVVDDLAAQGLLEKEEPYETQVGHSDRSKTPVEPYLSDQWFVKMAPLAEPALEVVREGKIKFYPERHAQQYLAWLGEKRDWPISRQLWWGHRIPVWTHPGEGLQVYRLYEDTGEIEGGYPSMQLRPEFADHVVDRPEEVRRADGAPSGVAIFRICVRPGHPGTEAILQELGFVQDPDVLDTWFSSALWPHSTLGWPDQTPELKRYYPTSVLVTGRDIITLWVARMVMTGLYNMGGVPFHDVAINPTILDGRGERMSKSKGNGVDPVDIIDTHGADALRFTLATMATETQDARLPVKRDEHGRNTSDKFDNGRNFANKLWNAARFALTSLEAFNARDSSSPQSSDLSPPSSESLPERWIVSRFNRTLEEANAALAAYRFDQYAKVCYDFFWRDFCDWYVEAAKPSLRDPVRAGESALVLAAVLDGALRLMHPMIPFITETIWWRLNDARPSRGLPGRIECPPSGRLIVASWPNVGAFDETAESLFPRIQELVVAIRNARNDYKADPRKAVTVSILAPGDWARQILDNRGTIELLANCALKDVRADLPPVPHAARATATGCELFVEGLVDETAERERIVKRREDLTRQATALRGRLTNAGYIAKAPPHLVEQTKTQLAEAESELAKLG